MVQYEIVRSSMGLDYLQEHVNELIKQGFVPVGGIVATSFSYNNPDAWAQAMFKAGKNHE